MLGTPVTAWESDSPSPPKRMATEEERRNLAWSLRPILICLRFLGLEVNWGEGRPETYRILNYLIRIFWILNCCAWIYMMANFQFKKEWKLNDCIEFLTQVVQSIGIYAAWLLANWSHGRKLVKSFQKIEASFTINQQALKKIRFVAIFGTVASIISVTYT